MNHMSPQLTTPSRSATILIIVAGLSALLASLALTFMVRMRSDVEESRLIVQEAQAQIMLTAGCNFIMERSRLGWDPVTVPGEIHSTIHREGFGWIDVRTGQIGPRDESGKMIGLPAPESATDPTAENIPEDWVNLGKPHALRPAKRCPMFVMLRPPYAVLPTVASNPISATGDDPLLPYLARPDPKPAVKSGDMIAYAKGDTRPDMGRQASAWFRVWRADPVTFVVTAGAGDTSGFRSWKEVQKDGQTDLFGGDGEQGKSMFYFLQQQEVRKWYLVEWSPYVASSDYQNLENEWGGKKVETFLQRPINTSQETRCQGRMVNHVGTIRSIQRLLNEPDHW
jgi:hypothetical protein